MLKSKMNLIMQPHMALAMNYYQAFSTGLKIFGSFKQAYPAVWCKTFGIFNEMIALAVVVIINMMHYTFRFERLIAYRAHFVLLGNHNVSQMIVFADSKGEQLPLPASAIFFFQHASSVFC